MVLRETIVRLSSVFLGALTLLLILQSIISGVLPHFEYQWWRCWNDSPSPHSAKQHVLVYLNISVFAHAEFNDEIVEIVLLGQLEQVLPRLLAQTQVHRVGVEPHLHYFSFLLGLDVPRKDRAEQRSLTISLIIIKENMRLTLQWSIDWKCRIYPDGTRPGQSGTAIPWCAHSD